MTYFIIALAACIACEKSTEERPSTIYEETISMKVGESVEVEADVLTVNFEDVVEDSRCPDGTECFWEGQAIVHLMVNTTKVVVTQRSGHEALAKDTLDNIVYTLLSVLPEANVDKLIPKEDYVIEIRVDKI